MNKVVIIGGGHGQSTILEGAKKVDDIELSAIVTVADDGGSTGRLRRHYNIPAMGDIRNVLLSLKTEDSLLSSLMEYRFGGEEEVDVEGHSLGNLILTALTDMDGSFDKAIEVLEKQLNVKGKIIPSSLEIISLYARMDDSTIVKGEASIPSFNHHIDAVFYDHDVQANPKAVEAILNADLIIYGIGSVYTSILPNIIIKDIQKALQETKAKRVYFANCMTQNNETLDYDLKAHVNALRQHGAPVDLVVKHNEKIPEAILQRYKNENSIEVVIKDEIDIPVVSYEMLSFARQLVRHDPEKIALVLKDLLEKIDVI